MIRALTFTLLASVSFSAFSQDLPGQGVVSNQQKQIQDAMKSIDAGVTC